MLRKYVFLSVVMVMILSLLGCGGGVSVEEEQEGVVEEEVVVEEEEVIEPEEEEEVSVTEEELATEEEEEVASPGKIAFVSQRDGNYEIYVMDADGSNTQRLTNNLARDSMPSLSP